MGKRIDEKLPVLLLAFGVWRLAIAYSPFLDRSSFRSSFRDNDVHTINSIF